MKQNRFIKLLAMIFIITIVSFSGCTEKEDGTAIRDNIRTVANPPGEEVTNISRGLELVQEGKEINY